MTDATSDNDDFAARKAECDDILRRDPRGKPMPQEKRPPAEETRVSFMGPPPEDD